MKNMVTTILLIHSFLPVEKLSLFLLPGQLVLLEIDDTYAGLWWGDIQRFRVVRHGHQSPILQLSRRPRAGHDTATADDDDALPADNDNHDDDADDDGTDHTAAQDRLPAHGASVWRQRTHGRGN